MIGVRHVGPKRTPALRGASLDANHPGGIASNIRALLASTIIFRPSSRRTI
jgi:hypothetical protein